MNRIGKNIRWIGLILGTIFWVAACLCAHAAVHTAYADDDVIVSDLSATEITYGEESKTFSAIVGTVNYEIFDYAWYRSDTVSGLPLKVAENRSTDGNLRLTITKPSDSGYYRAEITRVYTGDVGRTVSVESNTVLMRFLPKPVTVTATKTELVYDGTWQRPVLTVDSEEVLEGDTVNAYTDTGIATIDAGSYTAGIRLDNELYTVGRENEVTFTIQKAPLQIKTKDFAVRADTQYEFTILYDGLKGEDTPADLGFTPTIASMYYRYNSPGNYRIYCSGQSETKNYFVTYPAGNLYIAKNGLNAEEIVGTTATASGMFRIGTILTLEEGEKKTEGLPFLAVVKYNYGVKFTAGASEGATYALTIKDKSISPFMLAICYIDADGKIRTVERFSHKKGEVTISLPSEGVTRLVIYNDYTLVLIIGAVVALVLLIVLIAVAKSKSTYNRKKYFYEQAKDIADDYRIPQSQQQNSSNEDELF